MKEELWYRIKDSPVGDGWSRFDTIEYPVLRHTPKGVWLDVYGEKRFVRRDGHKRFACPTKEEAMESFKARKKQQAKILRAQLHRVELILYRLETT